jgi:hypothetical protein
VVNHAIVQQVSLASCEYPSGVNEFLKAGLTPLESELVKPLRVKESPIQIECKVRDVVELGTEGGAGNLVICEVVRMHIKEEVLAEDGLIDQDKLDLVGRLGRDWYCRTNGDALFYVEKPQIKLGIGVDQIPAAIRNSTVLTGNNLGQLGNVDRLPDEEEVNSFATDYRVREIVNSAADGMEKREALHILAQQLLEENQVWDAWKVLLQDKMAR